MVQAKKAKGPPSTPKRRRTTKRSAKLEQLRTNQDPSLENRVYAVLEEMMWASESDSVRVAAARTLLDRLKRTGAKPRDTSDGDEGERTLALAEAEAFLAALADAKFRSSGGAEQMDPDGAA